MMVIFFVRLLAQSFEAHLGPSVWEFEGSFQENIPSDISEEKETTLARALVTQWTTLDR